MSRSQAPAGRLALLGTPGIRGLTGSTSSGTPGIGNATRARSTRFPLLPPHGRPGKRPRTEPEAPGPAEAAAAIFIRSANYRPLVPHYACAERSAFFPRPAPGPRGTTGLQSSGQGIERRLVRARTTLPGNHRGAGPLVQKRGGAVGIVVHKQRRSAELN